MSKKIVVTNLRIPEDDWLQIKAIAAELGMSANGYVNWLIRDLSTKRSFGIVNTDESGQTIWDLPILAVKKNKPMGILSKEDKAIYG